jgi:imidazolonepropionase-like amidohydrolase
MGFTPSVANGDSVLIANVTVIDAAGNPPQSRMYVLIEDGYITAIDEEPIPSPEATTVDGTGRFLIPGLWDMHAHWENIEGILPNAEDFLPLFVANGVTGIRIMSGSPEHYEWKARIYEEELVSPRILVGSNIIDGPMKVLPWAIAASTPAEGRRYVRQFHEIGADFIKVYEGLAPDVYLAIADESRRLGIPFAGHVPVAVNIQDASDAGQKSVEHLTGVDLALSREREAIRATFIAETSSADPAGGINDETMPDFMAMQARMIDTYDPTLAAPVFQRLARNRTWQSPTLTVARNVASMRERMDLDKERLSYLPAAMSDFWSPANSDAKDFTEDDWRTAQRIFEHWKRLVGDMHRAGIPIIAGTDVLNPFCFPGFSLHDELALLVEAGLSPMEALQAATRNAAEFSDRLETLGTVEVGDLVLLDDNPLDDISNTTKISSVFFNGQLYDRDRLDAMLARLREMAAE